MSAPYELEAVIASHEGLLPRMKKNRRPSVQRVIEGYLAEEQRNPGHEHWSPSGLSAHVIAIHLNLQRAEWVLRVSPGNGYFIRRVL